MSISDVDGEMIALPTPRMFPDPLQLRRAVVAFRRVPADVGCLQARWGYFNERQNLLTRWFLDGVRPVVRRSASQLSGLGLRRTPRRHVGTTCGFWVWREVGGWDETQRHRGTQTSACGWPGTAIRTVIIDSITLEANSDVINWIGSGPAGTRATVDPDRAHAQTSAADPTDRAEPRCDWST